MWVSESMGNSLSLPSTRDVQGGRTTAMCGRTEDRRDSGLKNERNRGTLRSMPSCRSFMMSSLSYISLALAVKG
jgi:hypothetical protein